MPRLVTRAKVDQKQGNGQYVLYYSAVTSQNLNKHCVGAATSSQPQGPFTALDYPLFCDLAAGGAIDPNGAVDPQTGNLYVVYKVDGNSNGHGGACSNDVPPRVPTPIILQQVSDIDGTTLVGPGIEILTNIDEDGPLIEAPALTFEPSTQTYVLFYNSGCFTSSTYTVRYATSSSITGPYTRQGIFLATGSTAANVQIPGGIDVVGDGSKAVFHGDTNPGWFQGDGSKRVRSMYAIDLNLRDGKVTAGTLL
jgi:beta-xylosidase